MNIGIIVHSQTGNTKLVAQKLEEKLKTGENSVDLIHLKLKGEFKPEMKEFEFENMPDIRKYDMFVIGSSVQAFSLSPVIKSYLKNVDSFNGKKVACLITQHLPYKWLGGNNAVRQLKKICESKNGVVCGTGIVNWKNKNRDDDIEDTVTKLSSSLAE